MNVHGDIALQDTPYVTLAELDAREAAKRATRATHEQARVARRHAELTRMAERTDFVPTYRELYDQRGECVKRTYLGHRRVLARGTHFPTLLSAHRTPSHMAPLMANVSRIDLTRASGAQLAHWVTR